MRRIYYAFRLWLLYAQRDHVAHRQKEHEALAQMAKAHALDVDDQITVYEARMLAAQSSRSILRSYR